jgi:hypothetical protein
MQILRRASAACLLFFTAGAASRAQDAARLPVREVSVFKDGFGLVTIEGDLPVGPDGDVAYDAVPKAVVGAFWPTAAPGGPALKSAAVGRRRVRVEKTALDQRELIEANLGAEVFISELGQPPYPATLLGVPERSSEELARTSAPDQPERSGQKAAMFFVRKAEGTKAVNFDRVTDVVFRSPPKTQVTAEELRDSVTWRLDWQGRARTPTAKVALSYVQKGLRWQASYRVEIDGAGGAVVALTATLVNDLADLDDVDVNFVVGAPRLDFADHLDATVLDDAVRQMAYQSARQNDYSSNRLQFFSNASQLVVPGPDDAGVSEVEAGAGGPSLPGDRAEDLYVFAAKGVTLRRGGRLALRVAEWRLKYADVHKLDLGIAPPRELQRNCDDRRRAQIAKLVAAPKAVHHLRLVNSGAQPLTTGPAAIFSNGRLLGQSLLTYTAAGAATDLAMSAAVDLRVKRDDRRSEPIANAIKFGGDSYARVDVEGKVTISNFSTKKVTLEVSREALGALDLVEGGESRQIEPGDSDSASAATPPWWSWFSWPYWWHEINGVGRATWKLELEPAASVTLSSKWHYFWR